MKKKILSILLAACLIFSLLPVSAMADAAESGACGDNLTWTLENGVLTISGTGEMDGYGYYTKKPDGSSVTSAPWGEYYEAIERVVIENGVTSIGNCAFYSCTEIKGASIPDSVESIGRYAFTGCSGLETVTLGNRLKTIEYDTFCDCTSLKSIVIPDSVESIEDDAFSGCSSLETVTLGKGVKTIRAGLLSAAFKGCKNVTDVYYTGDINSWLGIQFEDSYSNPCYSSSASDKNVNLYFGGQLVTSVVIPDGVTSIGNHAFAGCNGIVSVTIPDSVTNIGSSAFDYCTGLEEVTLGEGIKTIGSSALKKCTSLKNIDIPDSITSIGKEAFSYCEGLKNIDIPNSVTSIGEQAFEYCTGLRSIKLPDNIKSISRYMLGGCQILKSVTIPESVTTIGENAFYRCNGLTSIVIPDSVTSIDDGAFWWCERLETVTLGKGVKSIGTWAFASCNSISKVYYTGDINSWLGIKFDYSTANPCGGNVVGDVDLYIDGQLMTSVVIPDGVKNIGDYVFYGCTGIESVTIPSGVKSIGVGAFEYCTGLTSVVIPSGVTKIGRWAFYGCQKLKGVVIPSSVTSIGEDAFYDCGYDFRDVAFGGTADEWDDIGYTFDSYSQPVNIHYNCTSLDGHYVQTERVEPTCTTEGYAKYSCACGYEYTEKLTLEHNYVLVRTEAPTCTRHGYDIYKCSYCGNEKREYHDDVIKGHNYIDTVVQPTCTSGGYTVRKCSNCGDSSTYAYIAALGHSYANGKCTRCGAADPNYKPAPKAPELKITTSAGKPKIYWNAVDGAAKYWIYRSTDGKNFSYYDSTTKTSYTNNSTSIGTTYYYKVKAVAVVDGKDYASDYSVIRSILCKPAAPSVSINRSNGKPKLSWKAVSGATKYWIYRSTDGKEFKYFDSTTKTSYTNSGAASGTKYYYRVKAVAVVNGKNVTSANSSTKSLFTSLAKPSVSITTSNGKPKLTWKAVTGADKYYVYRSTDGKNFSYWDSTTKTSYVNSGAKKNTKYYYKVKAVCASNSNANSAQSAAVSIKATK
ncbi:MAG: leucine-rich repeat protein [Firmicutes bacterium]|nr:leucine-rich repeat protein [Bacillota bacterium]